MLRDGSTCARKSTSAMPKWADSRSSCGTTLLGNNEPESPRRSEASSRVALMKPSRRRLGQAPTTIGAILRRKAMVIVCAWCRRFLGFRGRPEETTVSHGICSTCAACLSWLDTPTLVVSRSHQEMVPVLREMLRGAPEVPIVVDRRLGERRAARPAERCLDDRRSGRERRSRRPDLLLA